MAIGTETRALKRSALVLALSAGLTAGSAPAIAQQSAAQQAADVQQRLQEAPAPLAPQAAAPAPAPLPPGAADQIVPVTSVALVDGDGAPLGAEQGLPLSVMNAAVAPLVGASPSVADIIRATDALKARLREDGYLFTSVSDPMMTPDGEGGVALTIAVAGAVITEVTVTTRDSSGDQPAMFAALEKLVRPLEGKLNPRLADLERASLLASDIPGVRRATFVPAAGDAPGELKLFLNVDHAPYDAVLFADNRQAPSLGPILGGAIFSLNSWNRYAMTTELAVFNSFGDSDGLDLEERNTVQLTQRAIVGEGGTMIEARVLWSASAPGDELSDLGLTSSQVEVSFMAEHPLLRTRALSFWAAAGAGWDNSVSELNGGVTLSDDTVAPVFARLRGVQRDSGGYTSGSVEFRAGMNWLGASKSGDNTLSRTGSSGEFTLVELNFERSQTLFDRFSAFGRVNAQFTNDRLLSSQQIAAGGGLYAKAYDPSEVAGDRGYMVYGELRYDQETVIQGRELGMQLYAFADFAEVRLLDVNAIGQPDLSSAGTGLRLNYARTNLELEVAFPIAGPVARNSSYDPRFFFGLTQRF